MTTSLKNKKYLAIELTLLVLTSLISSCDCLQNVSGTVFDKNTKQPLDSVYACNKDKGFGVFTNNKGDFKLNAISGGLYGCPPMTVTLTKTGYDPVKIKIKNARHKKIYMTKKQ